MFTVDRAEGAGPLLCFKYFLTLLLSLLHFPPSQNPLSVPLPRDLPSSYLFYFFLRVVRSPLPPTPTPLNRLHALQFSYANSQPCRHLLKKTQLGRLPTGGKQTAITSAIYLSVSLSLSLQPALQNFPEKTNIMWRWKEKRALFCRGLGCASCTVMLWGGHFITVVGCQSQQGLLCWPKTFFLF